MARRAADERGSSVEPQRLGQPRPAGTVGELGFPGVSRVRTGFEPAEVTVERGLGRTLAGAVGHHQRRVEGDQAVALHIGLQGGQHVGVVADNAGTHQTAA